jgi:hypothetical protein
MCILGEPTEGKVVPATTDRQVRISTQATSSGIPGGSVR